MLCLVYLVGPVAYLYMRCSDIIESSIKPRRHFRGIFNLNTLNSELKCGNLAILLPRLFAGGLFDWCIIPFRTVCTLQANLSYDNIHFSVPPVMVVVTTVYTLTCHPMYSGELYELRVEVKQYLLKHCLINFTYFS